MAEQDASLPMDARLYAFQYFYSVFPVPDWGSLAQWKTERKKIRQHIWMCSGLNDQTMAYKARGRVIRMFEHEGIAVENIRIETLPGVYVMGNLYRPAGARGKLPLILNPHGHGMHSRTRGSAVRAMNQALLGFTTFAWSMTSHEDDSMQIEHRAFLEGPEKAVCNVLGLSAFGLQLHNSIKVLDYLLSRGDVDGRRVGCTGASGGGTQTYYLAAVDDRVKVAAPAVMLSGHMQGGCVCENAPLLHLQYSTVHFAGLIAPRPLMLTGCTGDWTHHARERELASLRELYGLYGREEAVDAFYQDEKHNYDQASREHVNAWMVRWLKDKSFVERRIPESDRPAPEPDQLLVHKTPVPPVKHVVTSTRELIRVWTRFHQKPDAEANTASMLNLDYPDKGDILVRNQTPRYAYRKGTLGENMMVYGRFSEGSGLTCRFVPPRRGKSCLIVLRKWKDLGALQRFASKPPAAVQGLINEGHGVVLPLLFGQRPDEVVDAYRKAIEASYLFTSFNRTPHMHQAGDIVTTARLAEVEMRVPLRNLAIVADRDMALTAFVAWAFLCSQSKIGPFAGDLRGMDLTDPKNWVKHAYFPLIMRAGGVRDLVRLCERKRAFLSGVTPACRKLFPRGIRTSEEKMGLEGLLEEAAKLVP